MGSLPDNILTRTVARNQKLGWAAAGCGLLGAVMYMAGLLPTSPYAPIQFAGAFLLATGAVCFALAFVLTNNKLRCSRCLQRFFINAASPATSKGTNVFSSRCGHCGYPAGATFESDAGKRAQHAEARTLSVRIYCPHCSAAVTAEQRSDDIRGKSIKCSRCGQSFSKRQSRLASLKSDHHEH